MKPLIVLSVPRSGSTLLRFMLGQHPNIVALPETPWILGSYGPDISLRALVDHVSKHELGAVRNVSGVSREDVFAAARAFVYRLVEGKTKSAIYLAIKTPDDIRYLDDLIDLFPDAKYLHIVRDGRDVAISTLKSFPRLSGFGLTNWDRALSRWATFEASIRRKTAHLEIHTVRYEDLVSDPLAAAERICGFLGLEQPSRLLRYDKSTGDLPSREVGSRDVLRQNGINAAGLQRWRKLSPTWEMKAACQKYDKFLVEFGYEECGYTLHPAQRIAAGFSSGIHIARNKSRSIKRTMLARFSHVSTNS